MSEIAEGEIFGVAKPSKKRNENSYVKRRKTRAHLTKSGLKESGGFV